MHSRCNKQGIAKSITCKKKYTKKKHCTTPCVTVVSSERKEKKEHFGFMLKQYYIENTIKYQIQFRQPYPTPMFFGWDVTPQYLTLLQRLLALLWPQQHAAQCNTFGESIWIFLWRL